MGDCSDNFGGFDIGLERVNTSKILLLEPSRHSKEILYNPSKKNEPFYNKNCNIHTRNMVAICFN